MPGYMKTLRCKLDKPVPMSIFSQERFGVASILKKLQLPKDDLAGCYVLLHRKKPLYVGISRTVVQRLRNHVYGKTDSTATLACRMATAQIKHGKTQKKAMEDSAFIKAFEQNKALLTKCKVAFIPVKTPLKRCLFEAYCAMELNTCKWNTFDTH
jgi:predicted GIY-YIG superfamily endonuclease